MIIEGEEPGEMEIMAAALGCGGEALLALVEGVSFEELAARFGEAGDEARLRRRFENMAEVLAALAQGLMEAERQDEGVH